MNNNLQENWRAICGDWGGGDITYGAFKPSRLLVLPSKELYKYCHSVFICPICKEIILSMQEWYQNKTWKDEWIPKKT